MALSVGVFVIPGVVHLSVLHKHDKVVVLIGEVHSTSEAYKIKLSYLPKHIKRLLVQEFITSVTANRRAKHLLLEVNASKDDPRVPDTSALSGGRIKFLANWVCLQKDITPHWIDPRKKMFDRRQEPLSSDKTNPISDVLKFMVSRACALQFCKMDAKLATEGVQSQQRQKQVRSCITQLKNKPVLQTLTTLSEPQLKVAVLQCLFEMIAGVRGHRARKDRWCNFAFEIFFTQNYGRLSEIMYDIRALVQSKDTTGDVTENARLLYRCIKALEAFETRLNAFRVDVRVFQSLFQPDVKTAVVYMGAAHTSLTQRMLTDSGFSLTHAQHAVECSATHVSYDCDPMLVNMHKIQSAVSLASKRAEHRTCNAEIVSSILTFG